MIFRDCAAGSSAFRTLLEVYQNREAAIAQLKAGSKPLIGKVGCDVPDELLIAAGFQPVQIWSDEQIATAPADKYLEYCFDPMVRRQFSMLVSGKAKAFCDHVFISNSTDALIRMYLYLREIKRTEPDNQLPELHFIDWIFTRRPSYRNRSLFVLDLLKQELEAICGHEIAEDAIREANALCEENRAALRTLQALRLEGRVSGCEMLVAIGAGFYLTKEDHTSLVQQLCADAAQWPVLVGPAVFYTGSAQEGLWVYDQLESSGVRVVSEDHDWGARSFDGAIDDTLPALEGLADRYLLRSFSSKKAFVSQRVETLLAQRAESAADAVLFFTNIYEEPASWDYPSQKQALDEQGIPSLSIIKQQYPAAANEGLAETLHGFAETLKGGVQNG